MKTKDTDPHGISASMKLVSDIAELMSRKELMEGHSMTEWVLREKCFNKLIRKARRIRKKFKNDYDRAGGKL